MSIFTYIPKIGSIEQLYAYAYQPRIPFTANNGWKIYDPIKEYQRMGVDNTTDMWRFTTINQDYKVTMTHYISHIYTNIIHIVFTYLSAYNGGAF
jgi:myotubularin-related protein 6/7/8